MKVVGIEILGEERFGGTDGFLLLHRVRLRNRREDGSYSEPYICDYVDRPRAQDAVVVACYQRREAGVWVLIRDGLRPPLSLSRDDEDALFCSETVAGLIENTDVGPTGILSRAAAEVHEEAGYRVEAGDVEMLGAKTYPAPGAIPEAFVMTCVEIPEGAPSEPPPGDGSPMEEGAHVRWMPLDEAIAKYTAGEMRDLKSEVVLRRLRDHLQGAL